jgi:hypothetical protein
MQSSQALAPCPGNRRARSAPIEHFKIHRSIKGASFRFSFIDSAVSRFQPAIGRVEGSEPKRAVLPAGFGHALATARAAEAERRRSSTAFRHSPRKSGLETGARKRQSIRDRSALKLVGVRGFEPPTPCSRSRCATRLRYTPTGGRSSAAPWSRALIMTTGAVRKGAKARKARAGPHRTKIRTLLARVLYCSLESV